MTATPFSWHGKKVFLTGHTGFKGGWLALWLASKGALVRGYALDPSTDPNLFTAARIGSSAPSEIGTISPENDIRGDIRNPTTLEPALTSFAPEVVFHLAAQPLVRLSYADPITTYETNVIGTARVLDTIRRASSVKAVVSVTTDKCYENKEWVWGYRETDPLGGYDPYSSSKACAEIVSAAYRQSYFPVAKLNQPGGHTTALATARAGNVIGGGDWSQDRLIPDLVRGFLAGQPVRIRRPHAIRPWQHVLEPLAGYIALAERLLSANPAPYATAYNFGPYDDDAKPVGWIVDRMTAFWGDGASWVLDEEEHVHEAGYLKLDASRAHADLQWRPRLRLETALQWLVEWYRAWQSGADMNAFTLAQIAAYEALPNHGNPMITEPSGRGYRWITLNRHFQETSKPMRPLRTASFCLLIILRPFTLLAQPTAPHSTPIRIPALFLSDIHLDPYADPAKVAKLNATPAADWPTLLAAPDSPTRAADFAALSQACPTRGNDTPDLLFRSSLRAIHARAAHATFVTISGDLLAHAFDCKFKTLLPTATHADYLSFVEKTIRYEIASLREVLPGVPLYIAMGNNDSGCTDYALDPTADAFLTRTAKIVASSLPSGLPETDRAAVLRDFSAGGYFSAPLAGVPHTRLIALDDVYMSTGYVTCSGQPDPAPATAQLAWLSTQLAVAREHNERVWILGHIPPGVNLYGSARKLLTLCAGSQPVMFLGSEKLAEVLSVNADVIPLALFGHTHSDEMRLLTPDAASPQRTTDTVERSTHPLGVPLKIIASITPINGNKPTFTLASIDPATATLSDYTVIMASNAAGDATTTWAPSYTYSTAYRQPAFNAAALSTLIAGFQADPSAATPASQAYLRSYYPGDISAILQMVWPQYACSMNHDSAAAFTACSCATKPGTTTGGP